MMLVSAALALGYPIMVSAFPDESHAWIAPGSDDARSPCPGLNTLANHGFIPRNGRDIAIDELAQIMEDVYSLNKTTAGDIIQFNVEYGWNVSQDSSTILSIADLYRHPPFDHDASLVRQDPFFEPFAQPDPTLVQQLVEASSDGVNLTIDDVAAFQTERILGSRRNNPNATFDNEPPLEVVTRLSFEKAFLFLLGVDPALQTIGVDAATTFLETNRLPEGYTPRQNRSLPVEDLIHGDSGLLVLAFTTSIEEALEVDVNETTPGPTVSPTSDAISVERYTVMALILCTFPLLWSFLF